MAGPIVKEGRSREDRSEMWSHSGGTSGDDISRQAEKTARVFPATPILIFTSARAERRGGTEGTGRTGGTGGTARKEGNGRKGIQETWTERTMACGHSRTDVGGCG